MIVRIDLLILRHHKSLKGIKAVCFVVIDFTNMGCSDFEMQYFIWFTNLSLLYQGAKNS